MFFCCDVGMNFLTGFIAEGGIEEMDPSLVASNYVRGWFTIDLLSSLPFDVIFESGAAGAAGGAKLLKAGKAMKILKMARLSKLVKMANATHAEAVEELVASSSIGFFLTLLKLICVAYFSCHLIACLWGWASAEGKYSWVYSYADGGDDRDLYEAASDWGKADVYLLCLYWAMTTITTVGYGDICPESSEERLVAICAMIAGTGFYSYVIGSVSSIISSTDSTQRTYLEKMDLVYS